MHTQWNCSSLCSSSFLLLSQVLSKPNRIKLTIQKTTTRPLVLNQSDWKLKEYTLKHSRRTCVCHWTFIIININFIITYLHIFYDTWAIYKEFSNGWNKILEKKNTTHYRIIQFYCFCVICIKQTCNREQNLFFLFFKYMTKQVTDESLHFFKYIKNRKQIIGTCRCDLIKKYLFL